MFTVHFTVLHVLHIHLWPAEGATMVRVCTYSTSKIPKRVKKSSDKEHIAYCQCFFFLIFIWKAGFFIISPSLQQI